MSAERLIADPGAIPDWSNRIRSGERDPRELVEALCARAAKVEPAVQAWCNIEREDALRQAEVLALEARAGRIRGPLHGIPFTAKDVIDVAGQPTRAGSPIRDKIAAATADAEVVAAARAAGAIIMGKTHTTAYAYFDSPPPTRNPWNTGHTPGGSSSGPAASVATGTALFSIGTQTAGSVVRPAAYCGVAAFKPTTLSHGTYGMVPLAPSFDTPGYFGYRVIDAAIVAATLLPPVLASTTRLKSGQARLKVGFVQDEILSRASDGVASSIEEAKRRLSAAGHEVRNVPSGQGLEHVIGLHTTISEYEIARVHGPLLSGDSALVSDSLRAAILRGRDITDQSYQQARVELVEARKKFWGTHTGSDVLVFPAAPDVAPAGMKTGDPSFIIPFTALAGPIMTVPIAIAASGLPLGAMLLGPPGGDDGLIADSLELSREIELGR